MSLTKPATFSTSQSRHTSHKDDQQTLTKEQRDKQRRRRNVESAKRSRDRKNEEERWKQMQILENEARIHYLESKVKRLQDELTATQPRSRPPYTQQQHKKLPKHKHKTPRTSQHSKKLEDRPSWFGDPF